MEVRSPRHLMVGGLRYCTWPNKPTLKTLWDSPLLIQEAAACFSHCCCLCVFNVNAFPLLQKMFPGYCSTLRVSLAWLEGKTKVSSYRGLRRLHSQDYPREYQQHAPRESRLWTIKKGERSYTRFLDKILRYDCHTRTQDSFLSFALNGDST